MYIKQLKWGYSDNFSYLIGCEKTGDAMVIDPSGNVEYIFDEADKAGFHIKYIVNTHGHSDHTSDILKRISDWKRSKLCNWGK